MAIQKDPLILESGTLLHQIIIQAISLLPDSTGQPQSSLTDVLTCRCSITTPTAKELFQTAQQGSVTATSQTTHTVTIRWPGSSVSIQPGMQISFGNLRFLIQSVDNIQMRNRVVKMMCLSLNEAAT